MQVSQPLARAQFFRRRQLCPLNTWRPLSRLRRRAWWPALRGRAAPALGRPQAGDALLLLKERSFPKCDADHQSKPLRFFQPCITGGLAKSFVLLGRQAEVLLLGELLHVAPASSHDCANATADPRVKSPPWWTRRWLQRDAVNIGDENELAGSADSTQTPAHEASGSAAVTPSHSSASDRRAGRRSRRRAGSARSRR